MHRWIGCIASLLLGLSAVSALRAQSPSDSAPPKVDPPDTEYRAGAQEPDPSVERRLQVVAPYRGYLPAVVELARMPPVGDQAATPSSAAWAAAYAARGFYAGALEGRDIGEPANVPSPSYVYHLARQGSCDDGSSIPRVVEVLRRGAPSLAEQPFSADCVPPALPSVVAAAHDFRVQGLRRIDLKRIDDVKGELAGSNPVIVELRVGAAFRHLRGDATLAETDADAASTDASQFVTLSGYDEHRQAFRLINSWGAGWGDRGYAWLGYDVFRARVARAYVLDVAAPRRAKVAGETAGKDADDLAALEDLACGKIRARTDGERRALSGFVASDADLEVINAVAARAQATSVADVAVAPWPLCEALQTLDHPLAAADPPKITVGGGATLRAGDTVTIEVRSAGPRRHLYVSYIQADGTIMHLAQPGATGDPTGAILTFGDGRQGRSRFLVGPPFGREMIVAIAAPQRLFDATLPARQAARDYLTALRRALIYRRSPDQPDIEASAAVKILRTQAR
ncbi:MAG: DUF4384 domain-containing protein [Xanthobacteraceae bacterium]